ncbi:hypothetical protein SAMD00019534_021050 [Acytostelium subglobosum LB1]|uniref:hypothetical protein n=1 Tax=Acytostelium subglobosum LB1 TaxID=1410327 RepID=UPI0006451B28|nr:hypothetical protein SAMD00019534_021050 [Acytostelium subglobosum LB1]GAM18930.1 hypothetical protein SAMD00019534_021050 [Acytostelium subglobosum LB1]|eukprot:XP_012758150.1 hypothetical protein SAMD00019534_021050 [Acytostelium subglobosum LB1]
MTAKDKANVTGSIRSQVRIFGCLGIINLLSGPHLLCITEKTDVGCIRGKHQSIHKVSKTQIFPILREPVPLSEEEKKEERTYITVLSDMLESFDFYFSYDFDVTHSEQRVSDIENDPHLSTLPLWKRADERFFWNRHLQQIFIKNEFHPFILPIMDGFIKILKCEINSNHFNYIFISRRSCKRTGARYHIRGADPHGNVANFVETEQIIAFGNVLTSFVQTRGSIPLIWQQKGKGMKPRPVVVNSPLIEEAFKAHLNELISLYGPQVLVSLIDQNGGEMAIGDAFETHAYLLFDKSRVEYHAFDFHEKCKNNKYENLGELLDKVKPRFDSFGYLFKSTAGTPTMLQSGSFRTNCIDCLDRTNVVQSVLARYILHSQLTRMGIISSAERIESHTTFDHQFKNVWADNADIMSEQYTGTVALKTDFTRTGKRSVKGTMTDGVNSVRRYINKNFKDDDKQLAIDLYLGKFTVEKWISELSSSDCGEYDVQLLVDGDEYRGVHSVLKISSSSQCIVSSTKASGRRKEYPFDSITLVEKGKLNHCLLGIYDIDNPTPDMFVFPSSLERERFMQDLYKQALKNCYVPINPMGPDGDMVTQSMLSPPMTSVQTQKSAEDIDSTGEDGAVELSPITSPSSTTAQQQRNTDEAHRLKLLELFDCFVGSWNMENFNINTASLSEWIPRNKDLYSISAQRFTSDRPSPGYVMNYKQYFFYLIRQYLGAQYIVVASAVTENTAAIVLVRKSLSTSVNNIVVSYLLKRPSHKRSLTSSPTSLTNSSGSGSTSPMIPVSESGSNSNSSSAVSKAASGLQTVTNFFRFGKLKETSAKPAELFKEYKNKDTQFGTSISFQLRETSLCFANYCNYANGSESPMDDNSIVHIKNRQYLNGSSRYTFWTGDYDSQALSNKLGWQPIVDLDVYQRNRGVVFYKAHPNVDPIASQEEALGDHQDSSYLYPPLSSTITVPVLAPFSWLSVADLPCFIFLSSLVVDNFELLPSNTKMDCFLEFNAFHLLTTMETTVRTGNARATITAPVTWNEKVELRSFIDDKEYLKTQFIQVALVSRDMLEHTLIGKGVIPLRDACGNGPSEFRISLCFEDEFACTLQGEIQVFSKLEVARIVEQQAATQQPPPVPTRNHPLHQQQTTPPGGVLNKPLPPTPSPSQQSPMHSPAILSNSPTTLMVNPTPMGDDSSPNQDQSLLGKLAKNLSMDDPLNSQEVLSTKDKDQ